MPKIKKEKPNENKYYWKGKPVSGKIYKLRLKQQEVGKKLRDKYGIRNAAYNLNASESSNKNVRSNNISSENIVIIAVSFDTGWTTKGSDRSYNSLSGTAEEALRLWNQKQQPC
ncbi:hypothetical protein PV327_008739 [Microctonus hyperodae]|uniref:Uncharacterized protein n=1 Tax=Microctonus hyperodae TaxID=165561 RepID=A0AA39FST4_MICHY|nr:hypothetical protein PV327_008739 [Microctonus hyperodae]